MRALDLKGGTVLIDDDAELPKAAIYIGTNGYAYYTTWKNGRSEGSTLHSFLMGGARKGYHIDHVNRNQLDNRRANLRFVTPQRNQVNRKSLNRNNTSGVRGVVRNRPNRKKPWRAQIFVDRKNIGLGEFYTIEEAAAARRDAEILYYGEECPCAA